MVISMIMEPYAVMFIFLKLFSFPNVFYSIECRGFFHHLCVSILSITCLSILESHILCSLLPIRFPIHTDLFPIPPKTFGVCFVFDNYVDKTLLKLFNPECNSFEHCHISFVVNVCITASCDFSFKLFKI